MAKLFALGFVTLLILSNPSEVFANGCQGAGPPSHRPTSLQFEMAGPSHPGEMILACRTFGVETDDIVRYVHPLGAAFGFPGEAHPFAISPQTGPEVLVDLDRDGQIDAAYDYQEIPSPCTVAKHLREGRDELGRTQ